jgi:hypothetical protein
LRVRTAFRLAIAGSLAAIGIGIGAAEAAQTNLSLQYVVMLANRTVGRVAIEAAFVDGAYAIALSGQTTGATFLLPSAETSMSARGTMRGPQVLPYEYNVVLAEEGVTAEGRMAFRNRNVVDLEVMPGLTPNWDRVDLTMAHVRGVLDPMSAMIVSIGHDGPVTGAEACNRTVPIFDGWQRFDLVLSYDRDEAVTGTGGYSGPAIVCHARYIPVAGHQPTHPPVVYMASNQRLEVWLMPVAGQPVLIPYLLLIGTEMGDLRIRLDSLSQR